MTLIEPYRIVVDQFSDKRPESQGGRRPRWLQALLVLPALVVAVIAWIVGSRMYNVAALLTATSILTGFTFAMALRFWDRSIAARSTPGEATDGELLLSLDHTRTHLIWTVTMGVAATATLVCVAIFCYPPSSIPLWVTVLSAFLVVYQLTLVIGALVQFYESSFTLR